MVNYKTQKINEKKTKKFYKYICASFRPIWFTQSNNGIYTSLTQGRARESRCLLWFSPDLARKPNQFTYPIAHNNQSISLSENPINSHTQLRTPISLSLSLSTVFLWVSLFNGRCCSAIIQFVWGVFVGASLLLVVLEFSATGCPHQSEIVQEDFIFCYWNCCSLCHQTNKAIRFSQGASPFRQQLLCFWSL